MSSSSLTDINYWCNNVYLQGYSRKYIDKINTDYDRLTRILKKKDSWIHTTPIDVVIEKITSLDVGKNTISKYIRVLAELRENDTEKCYLKELYQSFDREHAEDVKEKTHNKKYARYMEEYEYGQKHGIYSTFLKECQQKKMKPYTRKIKTLK